MEKNLFKSNNTTEDGICLEVKKVHQRDIAIIGIGAKLPMSESLYDFWDHLKNGKDFVDFPNDQRKQDILDLNNNLYKFGDDFKYAEAAYLSEIDKFDYDFFNISYKEACLMDPLQRLFLETSWHAIEDAGYTVERIGGSKTGVYLGHPLNSEYYDWVNKFEPEFSFMAMPGNISSIIASRISYILNLKGPSMLIDTACSSSLVALHLACQALRRKECEMAIVGGVNLIFNPVYSSNTPRPDILSSTFRAKPFDDSSDGTAMGEGSIAFMLKPLRTAKIDGDRIYAIIKGSAVNQDGNSIGITAPDIIMQRDVITKAWQDARIDPETISFIESHGTGTKLGDPIEMKGIIDAFNQFTNKHNICGIGAVKGNLGHLDSAAGILGILKTVLSLNNKQIPPIAHFKNLNSKIDLNDSPIYINSKLKKWVVPKGVPRRCGVSSFGLSGTNCHIVLEESIPIENKHEYKEKEYILCLSAKSENALKGNISNYLDFFNMFEDLNPGDVCYTASFCRNHFDHRIAIIGNSMNSFKSKLEVLLNEGFNNSERDIIYGIMKKDNLSGEIKDFNIEDKNSFKEIASQYVLGTKIDWGKMYGNENKIITLPKYSFKKERCWVNIPVSVKEDKIMMKNNDTDFKLNEIQKYLKVFIVKSFNIDQDSVDNEKDFFEFGIDSISIIQLRQAVEEKYKVNVTVDELFQNYVNIDKLSQYIMYQLPDEIEETKIRKKKNDKIIQKSTVSNMRVDLGTGSVNDNVKSIIEQQLSIMNEQLKLLNQGGISVYKNEEDNFVPENKNQFFRRFIVKEDSDFTEQQQKYFFPFIKKYIEKTKKSRQTSVDYKDNWANDRFISGFSQQWKEMMYPVMISDAKGTKIWDVDGNEYTDFSMGFGAMLLGYNQPIINGEIKKYIDSHIIIGPITPLAGEVTRLLHEITGVERFAFYNSGTEAVMFAVRIARATTGKNMIVVFEGSFHGTFDGVNATKDYSAQEQNRSLPVSLGSPYNYVKDVIVLKYDSDESLKFIKKNKDILAGVLVEPVQSRQPHIQPKEFLKELRLITEEAEIPLIFDEIITGFRIHPGGAQAFFEVEADIVTYGKIIGGGMPLGIVGGKAKYMDRIDGGRWDFGDDSSPDMNLIVTGGTFSCHPLAMVASKTILNFIKNNTEVYGRLNILTEKMTIFLNDFFSENEIPIYLVYCGSIFGFKPKKGVLFLRFLFYLLIYKGIYLWEGATCFLSASHSVEDITFFIKSIKDSCYELLISGAFSVSSKSLNKESFFDIDWLGDTKKDLVNEYLNIYGSVDWNSIDDRSKQKIVEMIKNDNSIEGVYPISHMQNYMLNYNLISSNSGGNIQVFQCKINLKLDVVMFTKAWNELIERHSYLRTGYAWKRLQNPVQIVYKNINFHVTSFDFSAFSLSKREKKLLDIIENEKHIKYNLSHPPFFNIILVKLGEESYQFIWSYIYSVFDGRSQDVLFEELFSLYKTRIENVKQKACDPLQYSEYVNLIKKRKLENAGDDYLANEFKKIKFDIKEMSLPLNEFKMTRKTINILKTEKRQIDTFCSKNRITLNSFIFGCWILLISLEKQIPDLIVGYSSYGRSLKIKGIENAVGIFNNIMPLSVCVDTKIDFIKWFKNINTRQIKNNEYEYLSLVEISKIINIPLNYIHNAISDSTIIFENNSNQSNKDSTYNELNIKDNFFNEHVRIPRRFFVNYINDKIEINILFNLLQFDEEKIELMIQNFINLVSCKFNKDSTLEDIRNMVIAGK